ncbi:unnamed protein product [Psylliodes chrysocephalus]|uniref:Uncharacterized protein n=1 Tax=Psylliodes chrysocephalus TaxID=3402493 RepID=A0A9P0D5Z6_9CUCU|nr:unnamed protein product [Psylliodes chrysocephala]
MECFSDEQRVSGSTSSSGIFPNEEIQPVAGFSKQQVFTLKQETVTSYISRKISTTTKRKMDNERLGLFKYDYHPFSIVEDRGFRNVVHMLNPSYSLPNRQTISNTLIPLEYEKCLDSAKAEIQNVVNIYLTTGCWTSVKNEGYMARTGDYIDNNFKMRSILLSCELQEENHTAINLASRFKDVLKNWQLRKKDTLGLVKEVLDKVKSIVAHLRRSTVANTKLKKFQKQVGIDPPKMLTQDVTTRCNSTFHMILRFVELEDPLRSVIGLLDTRLPHLDTNEWTLLKELCNILKHFDATKNIYNITTKNILWMLVLKKPGGLRVRNDLEFAEQLLQVCRNSDTDYINVENESEDVPVQITIVESIPSGSKSTDDEIPEVTGNKSKDIENVHPETTGPTKFKKRKRENPTGQYLKFKKEFYNKLQEDREKAREEKRIREEKTRKV